MMLTVACLASGVVDQMPVNKWDLNSTCLLSILSLYLLHSVFVPTYMCVSVFVCKSLWVCVWLCYRWPPSRWENAGSLLVCVHMYQTQHVFPFQRRGILCVYVCACMCVYVCRRSRWAADFQEPLQQKQALCVSCSRTPLSQDTHTHTHTRIIALFSFPLQVSSTPILVPPAVKMFHCDCHERTCSLGAN